MNSRKENGGGPGKQSKTQKRTKETGKKKAVERERSAQQAINPYEQQIVRTGRGTKIVLLFNRS